MKQATLLLPLCLGLVGPALSAAQEPPAGSGTEQETGGEAAREERFIKHLLHLKEGRILRVRARATEEGWEIQSGETIWTLPAGAVDRAERERDVLAEAERLARQGDEKDPLRRVALAEWMFKKGLVEEALDEIDAVLLASPDQAEALALLQRERPEIVLPPLAPDAEALTTFLRMVAGAKRVAKEVAILRLGELRAEVDLQSLLRDELVQQSVRRRAFAAHALRRLFPGQEVKAMLNRAVLDGSADVREEASLALRAADDPGVMVPVLRALGSSSSAVRTNAAEALGTMGYAHAVEPLYNHLVSVSSAAQAGDYRPPAAHIYIGRQISYVQDYDVEVAQNAAIADPVINTLQEASVLDVRVLAVSETQIASEKATLRRSLSRLTGANPGASTQAWKDWWAEHGAEWSMGESPSPSPSTPSTPGR